MPTSDKGANRLILESIEKKVDLIEADVKSIVKCMYGKNGNAQSKGLVEIVHDNEDWINEQKDRQKWAVRGLLTLIMANLIAMLGGIWYFIHFGQKLAN